jgi:DNA topoisomerase I
LAEFSALHCCPYKNFKTTQVGFRSLSTPIQFGISNCNHADQTSSFEAQNGAIMTARTEGLEAEYYRREGSKEKGFKYSSPTGQLLKDQDQLQRIAKLAVPPGYSDVYVAPDPDLELQAYGRDDKGRLQYRYHSDFVNANARSKWSRLVRFAGALPDMRAKTGHDLKTAELCDRRVMALMTRLLYIAHFRVGSDEYARVNKTYGLSTLRKRHVKLDGSTVEFHFRGKHGIQQHKATADEAIARNVSALLELPGPWLFQCSLEDGKRRVNAQELNAYIHETMGEFSAKDFRTWGGTLLAAEFLADAGVAQSDRQARANLNECVKFVAADLGNTPAVVRAHYVSPSVFDNYLAGKVLEDFEPSISRLRASGETGLTRSELALKRLLERSQKFQKKSKGASPTT